MIFSARQLQDLLKAQGKIVLPYRARLTPAAQDWVKHNKVSIGYGEVSGKIETGSAKPQAAEKVAPRFLWWSDGPDGVVKAAIGMAAREVRLESMAILEDASRSVSAVRTLSQAIHSGSAAGGVMVVKNAGPAVIWANKAPNIRAVVATTMAAIEESIESMAANVLVIERDKSSLSQLKNMLVRFCRNERKMDAVVRQELESLRKSEFCGEGKGCSCGCKK